MKASLFWLKCFWN